MISKRRRLFEQIRSAQVDGDIRQMLYRLLDQGKTSDVEGFLLTARQIVTLTEAGR